MMHIVLVATTMLDDRDREFINIMDSLVAEVIRLWYGLLKKEPACEATGMLLVRCSASWKSICIILTHCVDQDELELCSHDAAALLRCMHDVCIQAEYIAAGDSGRNLTPDALGKLYLEYEHVERYRLSTTVVGFKSDLAARLRASPLRAAGEAHNQAEFDRVKANYPDLNHWYRGSLAHIAEKVGRKEEYFWFTTLLHSSIHGGPHSCRNGPVIQPIDPVLMTAMTIIRRLLVAVTKLNGLLLSPQSLEMMAATQGDLLNM